MLKIEQDTINKLNSGASFNCTLYDFFKQLGFNNLANLMIETGKSNGHQTNQPIPNNPIGLCEEAVGRGPMANNPEH
jgi:hypothetical protein